MKSPPALPSIDLSPLIKGRPEARLEVQQVAEQIRNACREVGFFYIKNAGVDEELQTRLEALSAEFFTRPEAEKQQIAMAHGGKAWRGYFPVGDELTSGQPDLKEGLYFGAELTGTDSRVKAGLPLHGHTLFPKGLPSFRETVLAYMEALTRTGHALMRGISRSLGLRSDYFHRHYTAQPLVLFRIFHYPPVHKAQAQWGVGEHTDYGLLTILKQDQQGGLQVKTPSGWIDAPPIPGTFVCNIGDMLELITGGTYRSTPHRVRNVSGQSRFSFPFFFDPAFDACVRPIAGLSKAGIARDAQNRWDEADLHAFEGTYGDYILKKVAKVFPALSKDAL